MMVVGMLGRLLVWVVGMLRGLRMLVMLVMMLEKGLGLEMEKVREAVLGLEVGKVIG